MFSFNPMYLVVLVAQIAVSCFLYQLNFFDYFRTLMLLMLVED